MTTTFGDLLARADDETLQDLLGKSVVRLLTQLDPQLSRPRRLRELIAELRDPAEMLRTKRDRQLLLQLLPRDEARRLQVELEPYLPAGDNPYVQLMKFSPRKKSKAEQALFSLLGVVEEPEEELDSAPVVQVVNPTYALFEHQRRAANRLGGLLAQPPHRAVLHMPTGSGKTRTSMDLIARELRGGAPRLVVWLAYSEELCEQTASEFEKAWTYHGDRPTSIFRYWGEHSIDISQLQDGLLVAGLGKMYASVKKEYGFWARIADRTRLVIIDEAHQAIAETYRAVLELLSERHEHTRLLGLTATPGRTWNDVDEDEKLSAFFARNKVSLEVEGYSNPIDYLVEQGYLAKAEFESLTYEGGADLSPHDRARLAESLDVPTSILERLAVDEQRNLLIVSRIEQLTRAHQRILIFATTVEHAEMLAVVLRARGMHANAITGRTAPAERERVIRGFKSNSGEVRILCNYGVLTTGFDAPRTSAAIVARPTKSLVLYSQMVGRATRGPKAGGNAEAKIVTVVDHALPGFADMSEAFTNWEDVWDG